MDELTPVQKLGQSVAGSDPATAPKPTPAPRPKAKPKSARPARQKRRSDAKAAKAPFGWNVIGTDDGRRIARSLPHSEAQAMATRITSMTGETITVEPAELAAPSVAIPDPEAAE